MTARIDTHSPSPPATQNNAVEVVAAFGDAVIGVRHLTDPRGGVVKKATKALLAGGVALLATSAISFGWAAHVAAKNEAGLKAWTAKGKPAWAYRPHMLPISFDVLTLGGSMLGIGAIAWGLARKKSEQNPARVRLGTATGCDFPMDGVGASFDLIAPLGDGFAVNVAPGMLGAPVGSHPVSATSKLRLQLGATTFHIQTVAAPRKTATGIAFDRRAAAFFAASAIAHLGILALLHTAPSDMDTANAYDPNLEGVLVDVSTDGKEPPVDTREESDDGSASDAAVGSQTAMALLEGTMGADQAVGDPGTRKVMKRTDRPAISAADAIAHAKAAGLFQSDVMRSDWSDISGSSHLETSGMDDADIYGGWEGDGNGTPQGFGNGRRGNGPGGGGDDWNSIYAGDYRKIPGGGGSGDDYNLDGGDPNHRRKHVATAPTTKFCQTTECVVGGDADPAIIRRYIKRSASKISYCYEKALLASPGLSGTVATRFTVMPDGHVTQSTASGVSEEVSSCMAAVISNIHFPAFKAAFEVKYPFHVHPAGA
jgi:hypothetical protein